MAFTVTAAATLLGGLPESPKIHEQNSDLDIFKAFLSLLTHVNTKIMQNLEVFTAKVYSKKTVKSNNVTELRWNVCLKDLKKKDIKMRVQM